MLDQTNWISNVIAGLALAEASYALYLQRRDRRPRLSISVRNDSAAPLIGDGAGGLMEGPTKESAQVFEIRNVGRLPVRIHAVQARRLWGPPFSVSCLWNRTPLLEPDTRCEATLLISQLPPEKLRGIPFYRVEFLDAVGRRWSPGLRRVPT